MAVTFIPIASQMLSASAASVTFSAIPQTFTDILVRMSMRNNNAGQFGYPDPYLIKPNNSNSSYSKIDIVNMDNAASSSVISNSSEATSRYAVNNGNSTALTFSSSEIYIPNYTANSFKQISVSSVSEFNDAAKGGGSYTAILWRDTSAITSLVIQSVFGSFVSGSSFHLYGIKNS